MAVERIEAELATVVDRIAKLKTELTECELWANKLRTSLDVLRQLGSAGHASAALPPLGARGEGAIGAIWRMDFNTKRPPSLATGRALEAGQALLEKLRASGDFMRPLDAVQWLKDKRGIRIGAGVPGRETSDLSAAIGHGRVPGLVVTRGQGYGLVEWNGVAPRKPALSPDLAPNLSHTPDEAQENAAGNSDDNEMGEQNA